MTEMYKYKKKVNITYFSKIKESNIEDIAEGNTIFIKVKSPLNYGVREWFYYGRLIKKTNNFFDILEYFGNTNIDNWETEQIKMKENNPKKYTKRWAKKSIIEIYLVNTVEKIEIKEFETNNFVKARKRDIQN